MINFKDGEKIILIKRRHYLVFVLDLLPIALVSLFLLGAAVFFLTHGVPEGAVSLVEENTQLDLQSVVYVVVFSIFLLLLVLWNVAFVIITKHYLDCWIITDRRTIHAELLGFFSRFYSSVSHHRIQDVTVNVRGILPTVMKYGDMKIQTAGAFKKFVFRQVPDPYGTKSRLLEVSERYRGYVRGKRQKN